MNRLHWLDYLILASFFGVALAIGIFQACSGGRQKTIDEFLLDNRKLKVFPTALSFLVTMRSGVSMLGFSAEVYNWSTQWGFVVEFLSVPFATLIVERIFVPWIYRLKITSAYEYVLLRFESKALARLTSCAAIINGIIQLGSSLLAPSLAIEVATDLPMKVSTVLLAVFCTIYTALGGMRGIIWNDFLQGGIMFGGLCFILIEGCKLLGGIRSAWDISQDEGRLILANFDPNPFIRSSFWTLFIGIGCNVISYAGTQQMCVQRYVSLPSLKSARHMLLLFMLLSIIFGIISLLVAMVQFAYFAHVKCDPFQAGLISSPNQLFSLFVGLQLISFKGFNGIILVVLYSSSLSTASSVLSGITANTWEDFLKPLLHTRVTEAKATLINKGLVIIFAMLGVAMTFTVANLPGNIMVLMISTIGVFSGAMLGIFFLGGLTHKTEWIGTLVGGILGVSVNLFIFLGSVFTGAGHYNSLPPVSTTGCVKFINQTYRQDFINLTNYLTLYHDDLQTSVHPNKTRLFYPVKPLTGFKKIFAISNMFYSPIGCLITIVVGYFVSVVIIHKLLGRSYKQVDKKYLIPFEEVFKGSQVYASNIKKSQLCDEGIQKNSNIKEDVAESKYMIDRSDSNSLNADSIL